ICEVTEDVQDWENHLILRVPKDIATKQFFFEQDKLHLFLVNAMLSDNLSKDIDDLAIQFTSTDMRHANVRLGTHIMSAKIYDLPCITEVVKTLDKKSVFKVADLSQIIVCSHDLCSIPKEAVKINNKKELKQWQYPHGLTPPMKSVRQRRFRKTKKKKYMEAPEVERELKRLLRADLEAESFRWEIVQVDEKRKENTYVLVVNFEKSWIMGVQEDDGNQVDMGGAGIDVYPRVVVEKGMHSDRVVMDPAERYAHGNTKKTMTRYVSSLRNMIPLRTTRRNDVKGGAKIDESGLFSFITYSWVFEYLYSALKGKLDKDQFDWNGLLFRMEVLWDDEVRRNPHSPSLFRALFRFIKTRLWAACSVFLFCLIFGFIGPTCLIRGLVQFAERPPVLGESVNYRLGFFLVFAICLVEVARVLSYGATWAVSYRTGIRVRGALLGLLFKRLLRARSLGKKTSAEIVNMFANDGQRLFDAVTFAPLVIIGPFVLIGMRHAEKIEIRTAGYAQSLAIACGPVVPVVAAILTFLGVVLSGHDLLASDAFSAITVFFVMLFGIRMIPYGSRYLAEALVAVRRIQDILLYEQWEPVQSHVNDQSIAVRFNQATFAWSPLSSNIEGTLKLALLEEDIRKVVALQGSLYFSGESLANPTEETPVNTRQTSFCLENITLTIRKKELTGICGAVGSGKSALLSSIIGHVGVDILFMFDPFDCTIWMFTHKGDLEICGTFAYVPQVPWIQNATVQENILFGSPMHSQRYYKAISSCQLAKDMEALSAGDHTEIGERGVTLSGGQKTRVSLARAIFAYKDIYLLDDVFASLDKKVGDKIFEKAVRGVLCAKTVIIVTTDPQRLSQCDNVVLMDNGRIIANGNHEELLSTCTQYREYCESALVRGKLIDEEEDLGLASMPFSVYRTYIRAAGSWVVWVLLLSAFILNVSASIFSTFWLSRWLKTGHKEELVETNGSMLLHSEGSLADSPETPYYSTVYGVSLVILFLSGLLKAMVFVKISLNAASRLHNEMFASVIRSTVSFFDCTPTGRILNRFSKDMDEIDVKLPFTAEVFLQNMITCIGFLIVITWVFPAFLIACVPLFAIFLLFVMCFRAGIRSLKRSENVSRSPLFDHITISMEGLACIHTYGQTARFMETFKHFLDANSGAVFMFQSAMRWLAVWLDLLVVMITSIVAFFIVFLTGTLSPADAGMALAFAVQMSGIFQFAVRTQTELEAKMTSVERVAYYSENIQQEGEWETTKGIDVPKEWPQYGQINFHGVKYVQSYHLLEISKQIRRKKLVENWRKHDRLEKRTLATFAACRLSALSILFPSSSAIVYFRLRYRPKYPLALNDITFEIKSKEKIGIIGRTGSGKSSLGNVLYRLYPITFGRIFIDGVDIYTVGLHRLRRAMAIIPQDPVLFAGTIRTNLDPNNTVTDSEIWMALEKTYLKSTIVNLENKLEFEVATGGENFSVGERQLVCLAKALLSKAKIILLDEATASLDISMDRLIQKVIKEAFFDATVIIIAHRLESVYGLDKVLIMDGGKLVEYDRPEVLLNKTVSELRTLANRTVIEDEVAIESEGVGSESSPEIMDKREIGDSESTPEIVNKDVSPDSESMPEIVEKQESDDENDSVEILDRPTVTNRSSLDDDDIEVLSAPQKI
ncbi:ABC transporter, ATP-binding protein, partial [Dictyocaulus viviparus]